MSGYTNLEIPVSDGDQSVFEPAKTRRLFHATCESFDGPPRPGGYDGVFWTAEHSATAQTYIPASGGSTYIRLSSFELESSVRPRRFDVLYAVAKMIGPEASDIRYDDRGDPVSWRQPPGYARVRDVVRHIEEVLGYSNLSNAQGVFQYEVRTDGRVPGTEDPRVVPADYRMPGSLLIVEGFEGMRFLNMATGESDLTAVQYHRLKTFRRAEADGYDGIVIDDFAQSKTWGNVGHLSIGFFAHAIPRLAITTIPACRFDWGETLAELRVTDTPEYAAFKAAEAARHCALTPAQAPTVSPPA